MYDLVSKPSILYGFESLVSLKRQESQINETEMKFRTREKQHLTYLKINKPEDKYFKKMPRDKTKWPNYCNYFTLKHKAYQC